MWLEIVEIHHYGMIIGFPEVQYVCLRVMHSFSYQVWVRNLSISDAFMVSDIIFGEHWRWLNCHGRHYWLCHEVISSIPPSLKLNLVRKDKSLWGKSEFSIQQTWETLRIRRPSSSWAKVVWANTIPRYAFILWLIIQQRFSTQDRLISWGIVSNVSCTFCRLHIENWRGDFWTVKSSWPNTSSSWTKGLGDVLFLIHTLNGVFFPGITPMIKLVYR